MGKFLLYFLAIYAVYANKSFFIAPTAPNIDLSETDGENLHLGPKMVKPLVVSFVIDQCGYSDRALKIMNRVRSRFPYESLDVVGVYMNPSDNNQLINFKQQKGAQFPLANGQPNIESHIKLINSFEIGYLGRTIYVVNKSGKIYSVDADKDGADVILRNLLKTIKKRTGLKDQPGVPEPTAH
ncbi:MAG: redoxin domain-containing protein [Pseudomonadota bacterium]